MIFTINRLSARINGVMSDFSLINIKINELRNEVCKLEEELHTLKNLID